MRGLLLVLVACGHPSPPQKPAIGNEGSDVAVAAPAPTAQCKLVGDATDKGAAGPAIGATIVAVVPGHEEETALTDDDGDFAIILDGGSFELTVYYADLTYKGQVAKCPAKPVHIEIDSASGKGGEVLPLVMHR